MLPCGFRVSGTLPKFCAVRKYEIQGVTLANFFLTLCLVGCMSRELCLNSAWSQDMKYRASRSPLFCESLPCRFSVSGSLPKYCVVRKYETQGVTLAIFSDSLPCGFSVSGTLPKFCAVRRYELQGVTPAIFSDQTSRRKIDPNLSNFEPKIDPKS